MMKTINSKSHSVLAACFILYTLIWLAGSAFIYYIFRTDGRDMIWVMDGLYQHFPTFSYICDITESVFHGNHDLSGFLPFNYSLGQGADLFTTLNSYDFADPVSWLCSSLLFMTRVHRYTVMVFSKLWLCGASFLVYCFTTGRRNLWGTLCGALAYTFSSNILYMFSMHPNFISWAYFLPLMLGGYELYRGSRKKWLLILSVFFNLLTNFYTFYINAILLVLYVVLRSLSAFSKNLTLHTFKEELATDLRAAGVCLTGGLLGAFSLFPTLYAYTQNPRVGGLNGYMDSMLMYSGRFYQNIIAALFGASFRVEFTTVFGLFQVILPAVLYFYISSSDDSSGKNRALKLYGFLLLIMVGIPMAGRIMNGMSYASNRWVYVIVFVSSVMLAESFEGLAASPLRKRLLIALAGLAYVVICYQMKTAFDGKFKRIYLALLVFTLLLYFLTGLRGPRLTAAALSAVTVASIFCQIYFIFAPGAGNYIAEFEKAQEHDCNYSDSSQALSGLSSEDDFFRVESKEHTVNIDGINKVNSTGAWWSMYPASMLDYLNAFESNAITQNCFYEGLFSRTALLELACVRYYTTFAKPPSLIPYGYEFSPELSDGDNLIYENTLCLPVGYSFQNYISRDRFDALGPVQRQQALLQGVVLDQDSCGGLPPQIAEAAVKDEVYELDYEIISQDRATMTENTMVSEDAGAIITLRSDIPANTEVYLQIEGIKIQSPDAGNIDVVRYDKELGSRDCRMGKISNLHNNWPVTRDGITYDLGIGNSGSAKIELHFSKKSNFTYDSMKLWAVPMDSYESYVTELRDHSLKNARVNGKEISGTTDFAQDRIMQFAVPYSTGWTAFIDGQKAPLMNSDILYMALAIPAGHHEVVLRYRTPFLREGAVVSLITLIAMIVLTARKKTSRK